MSQAQTPQPQPDEQVTERLERESGLHYSSDDMDDPDRDDFHLIAAVGEN